MLIYSIFFFHSHFIELGKRKTACCDLNKVTEVNTGAESQTQAICAKQSEAGT